MEAGDAFGHPSLVTPVFDKEGEDLASCGTTPPPPSDELSECADENECADVKKKRTHRGKRGRGRRRRGQGKRNESFPVKNTFIHVPDKTESFAQHRCSSPESKLATTSVDTKKVLTAASKIIRERNKEILEKDDEICNLKRRVQYLESHTSICPEMVCV